MINHPHSAQVPMEQGKCRLVNLMKVATLVVAAIATSAAPAAVINVNTAVDDLTVNGNCTLREAVEAANTNLAVDNCTAGTAGLDTINIPAGTYTITMAGAGEDANQTGDFDILEAADLDGAGMAATIIDGAGADRIIHVVNAVTVNISSVTIRNGIANPGGGIRINSGTLNVTNSTISGNSTTQDNGGGLWSAGTLTITDSIVNGNTSNSGAGGGMMIASGSLTITNSDISGNAANNSHAGGIYLTSDLVGIITGSTISNNTSTAGGGGIFTDPGITLTISNSTISGNSSGGGWSGGGIYTPGTLNLSNSTISNNSSSGGQPGGGIWSNGVVNLKNTIVASQAAGSDCNAVVSSTLNDLDSDGTCGVGTTAANPLLGTLANNGGPTQTHALLVGSPAIDNGDANTCAIAPVSGLDQRGVTRPQGAVCDIGAYEASDSSLATFWVSKNFIPDNAMEVEVFISCNDGLPIKNQQVITEDSGGVTFIVELYTPGNLACEITEAPVPSGYSASYAASAQANGTGSTGNIDGCQFAEVVGGDFTCEITNTADNATFEVHKSWEVIGEGGNLVPQDATIVISCNNRFKGGTSPDDRWTTKSRFFRKYNLTGSGTITAVVDSTDELVNCRANEINNFNDAIETEHTCDARDIGPGETSACVITNTVFFEGIPTLNRYGLALLVLLMSGIGAVGLRRFI